MKAVPGAGRRPELETKPPRTTPYMRLATDDRDEAESVVSQLYLPNRLDLSRGTEPLGMEVAGLRLGTLTVGRLTYGRRVRLGTANAENVHINIPLRGRAVSRRGTGAPVATRPGEGLVFSPGAPATMAWSADCEQLCLMVPQAGLETELERLLGRPLRSRLVFDFAPTDPDSALGRRWRTVLNLLVDELDHPTDLARNPLVGRHLEGLVLDGLLLGQPHSHSDDAVGDRQVRIGTALRHAVEVLEERPSEPWTTVRLAAEVHLSVRALQERFRRDLDMPPMTYLRQVRLRRAREALLAGDPDTTTVHAVAFGLGMLHMGRFAATYRRAFGESPSATLNRPI